MPNTDNNAGRQPKNAKMCDELTRLQTFENWDTEIYGPQQSRLAREGFMYTGQDGVIECFSCGMRFCCLKDKTDTASEHADLSPNCLSKQHNVPWHTQAHILPDRDMHLQPNEEQPNQDRSWEMLDQGTLNLRLSTTQFRIAATEDKLGDLTVKWDEMVQKFIRMHDIILEKHFSPLHVVSFKEMPQRLRFLVTEECLNEYKFLQRISMQGFHAQHLQKTLSLMEYRLMQLEILEQRILQDLSFYAKNNSKDMTLCPKVLQEGMVEVRCQVQNLTTERDELIKNICETQFYIFNKFLPQSSMDSSMDILKRLRILATQACLKDDVFLQNISELGSMAQQLQKLFSERKQMENKLKELKTSAKEILQILSSLPKGGVDSDGTTAPKTKPKFSDFRTKRARQRSYQAEKGWPEEVPHTTEQLAECGFFSLGIDDRVKCFSCGVVLRYLKQIDDLWVVHVKESSGCTYLAEKKGSDWVSAAMKERPSLELLPTVLDDGENTKPLDPNCLQITEVRSRKSSSSSSSSGSADSTEGNPISEEDVKLKREEYEKEKEDRLCKICLEKTVCVVFVGCGHTACETCASRLEKCHICREEIRERQEILFDGFRHDHNEPGP